MAENVDDCFWWIKKDKMRKCDKGGGNSRIMKKIVEDGGK